MGRDISHASELTDEIRKNAQVTIDRANLLLTKFKTARDTEYRKVTSGWRPRSLNAITRNAAPNSRHILGNAVDISDPKGTLDAWITDKVLEDCGLWREQPEKTPTWTHVQSVPYGSWVKGKSRTFKV